MTSDSITPLPEPIFAYHVLRYSPDLVRDEWVNIGVLLFDPRSGELRLRLIEGQEEFSRVRRLHPLTDEEAIRQLRDHLEDRFATSLRNSQRESDVPFAPAAALQVVLEKWNATLSNTIQLAPQKGVYAGDLDTELDRLYEEQVAVTRTRIRATAGSRATMRQYCSQVWRQARLWDRIERSVRIGDFTFPGDPTRIDYCYRHNGTRGFMQTLSVTRSPRDCKEFAYTAERIAKRGPFKSEFVAITDVELQKENPRHQFVSGTLRDAGIEPVALEGFAVWVAKLRAMLQ